MNVWFLCFLSVTCVDSAEWTNYNTGNDVNKSIIDAGNSYGETPLHLSIRRGYNNLTRLLIAGGANVSAENEDKDTPLHKAVIFKNIFAIKLLLDKNSTVNAKNVHQETPLYLATLSDSYKIAKILLEHGAYIQDDEKSPLATAVSNNYADIVDLFLNNGVSVDDKVKGFYLLEFSINAGANNVTKLLLDKGADYTITNSNGESLLYMAVYNANLEVAELLINASQFPVTKNKYPNAY